MCFQSRPQSFVPLDQRSENESSGSIHFEISKGNNRFLVIQFTAQSQSAFCGMLWRIPEGLLPELLFSRRWSRGSEALGMRLGFSVPVVNIARMCNTQSAGHCQDQACGPLRPAIIIGGKIPIKQKCNLIVPLGFRVI